MDVADREVPGVGPCIDERQILIRRGIDGIAQDREGRDAAREAPLARGIGRDLAEEVDLGDGKALHRLLGAGIVQSEAADEAEGDRAQGRHLDDGADLRRAIGGLACLLGNEEQAGEAEARDGGDDAELAVGGELARALWRLRRCGDEGFAMIHLAGPCRQGTASGELARNYLRIRCSFATYGGFATGNTRNTRYIDRIPTLWVQSRCQLRRLT